MFVTLTSLPTMVAGLSAMLWSIEDINAQTDAVTSGFPKKWENHYAALALYLAYYNFCRRDKTLRCTPAMAARIPKHVWTLKDLLMAATGI